MSNPNDFQIRHLVRADLPALVTLDRRVYAPDNWTAKDFADALGAQCAVGMVVATKHAIIGHFVYRVERRRFSIARIAIDPAHRDAGILPRVTQKLQFKLRPEAQTHAILDVAEGERDIQEALAALGWESRLKRGRTMRAPDVYRFYLKAAELANLTIEDVIRLDRQATA